MQRPDCKDCGFYQGTGLSDEAARKRASFAGVMPKGSCWRYPAMVQKAPEGEGCGEHTLLAGRTAIVIRGEDLRQADANGVRAFQPEPEPERETPRHAAERILADPAPEPARDAPDGEGGELSTQDQAREFFRAQKPNAKRRS